jgi:SH3-like domain-containing protein
MMRTSDLIVVSAVVCGVALAACSSSKKERVGRAGTEAGASADATAADSAGIAAGVDGRLSSARYMFVNVNVANVRAEPSTAGEIIAKMRYPDSTDVTGLREGEWIGVEFETSDGNYKTGWVHVSLLSETREAAKLKLEQPE